MKAIMLTILLLINYVNGSDLKIRQNIHLNMGGYNIESEDAMLNGIGYGIYTKFQNNIITGLDINVNMSKLKDNILIDYNVEGRLGYGITNYFNTYAIIGYKRIDSSGFNSTGPGFGIALEYLFKEELGIELKPMFYQNKHDKFKDVVSKETNVILSLKYFF